MKIEYIIIHHSLTKDSESKDWEAIRKYHIETNGWNDIGYHWGVEKVSGVIASLPGRPEDVVGAHVKDGGFNSKSLGICIVGNYNISKPPEDLLKAAVALVKHLMTKYGVPTNKVIGHREAQQMAGVPAGQRKSCPGNLFDMDAFRDRLKEGAGSALV